MAVATTWDEGQTAPIEGTLVPNEPDAPVPITARPTRRAWRDRVPYSETAEAAALGAALLKTEAADAVASIDPDYFYVPAHRVIARAIQRLRLDDHPADGAAVATELEAHDHRTEASLLVSLIAEAPSYNPSRFLMEIEKAAQARRVIALAGEVSQAGYASDLEGAAVGAAAIGDALMRGQGPDSSWAVVDLAATDDASLEPTMLARDDGVCLLYPGRVHAFNAPSESGKSWLALYACAERIEAGEEVLYLDFEDSAAGIKARLSELGLHPDHIHEQFHYVRPDDPLTEEAKALIETAVRTYAPSLVVIDGVTEVMVMNGWSIIDNDDVAAFLIALPRFIANMGPAVVMIDHVVKNKDNRGNDAIGGQHKRAGIDGASYSLEVIRPFGRGTSGLARIEVTKDRLGFVRGNAYHNKVIADFTMSADEEGNLSVSLSSNEGPQRPVELMEALSSLLQEDPSRHLSMDTLRGLTGKRKQTVIYALKLLSAEGYVHFVKGKYRHVRPFVAPKQEEF